MKTLARSALVGVAATAVDLATLTILVQVLGLRPEAANLPALVLGLVAQFVGNKLFAFGDHTTDRLARQGGLFLLVETGAFLLNAGIFHLLVTLTPIPYPVARVAGQSLVYFGFSYPLWGHVFAPRRGSC